MSTREKTGRSDDQTGRAPRHHRAAGLRCKTGLRAGLDPAVLGGLGPDMKDEVGRIELVNVGFREFPS